MLRMQKILKFRPPESPNQQKPSGSASLEDALLIGSNYATSENDLKLENSWWSFRETLKGLAVRLSEFSCLSSPLEVYLVVAMRVSRNASRLNGLVGCNLRII